MTNKTGGKCKTSKKLGKGYSKNDKRKIECNKARFKRSLFITSTNHYAGHEKIKWYSNHVEAFNMCLIEYEAIT
jgi:hypothetical protein